MFGAADRQLPWTAAELDGRAHALPRCDQSAGGEDLCGRGVSVELRENEFRDADSAGEISEGGMEGDDGRGRHRVDVGRREERVSARDQSGGRLFWGGSGNELGDE